ncbi:ATP-binding protein [Amycolatopsis orientalis]|uniref:ATP-binding protein n=1 Tax=Amycolatopsis orientalis TaxID=31958 RepID=UPI0004141CED|nr:tetratricopeptide repeat protein [Amycolatopsis orientalis]
MTPHQLPAVTATFVGREAELAKLSAIADRGGDGHSIGVAIVAGAPGVGKTALAVQWAHAQRERFPHGDLYCDLQGYAPGPPSTPHEVLAGFLRALEVPGKMIPRSLEAKSALFRSLVNDRRLVIVLDNVTSPHEVRALLPSTPGCFVMVTSRSSLSGLVVRNGARRITLDMLSPPESEALLRTAIGPERADEEPGVIGELADLCGHLPLALRIAGERVAAHPYLRLTDLLAELTSEARRLDAFETGDDEMSALRPVFSWSYRALDPATARVFRLLGLHPGPTVSVAAATVLAGTPMTDVRRRLDKLTGGCLLSEVDRDRFRFHDLLRVYAKERVDAEEPPEERENSPKRLLEWYLACADSADRVLTPMRRRTALEFSTGVANRLEFATYGDALAWCEAEQPNLVASVHAALAADWPSIACRLPLALWAFFTLRKPWADWIATYKAGVDAARRCSDEFSEASLLAGLGIAHRDLCRFEEALEYLESALAIRRRIGDSWGQGQALVSLGIAYHEQGRFTEALDHHADALSVFRRLGDEWGVAQTLHFVGLTNHGLGRFEQAYENLRQALEIRHRIGYRYGEAETLVGLALVFQKIDRSGESAGRLNRALELRRDMGDRYGEAAALDHLGQLWEARGELGSAAACWSDALKIFTELGAPRAADVHARLRRIQSREW